MTLVVLNLGDSSTGVGQTILVETGVTETSLEREGFQRAPAAIPADQVYYWSARWQKDEQESLAELAAGDFEQFESADDAIRWLLSADE